ncbi:hypothetical protein Csa_008381 [Cucumis sativus]|nr:hypothetical protein Csa_008381 [Cucumis sativus]
MSQTHRPQLPPVVTICDDAHGRKQSSYELANQFHDPKIGETSFYFQLPKRFVLLLETLFQIRKILLNSFRERPLFKISNKVLYLGRESRKQVMMGSIELPPTQNEFSLVYQQNHLNEGIAIDINCDKRSTTYTSSAMPESESEFQCS